MTKSGLALDSTITFLLAVEAQTTNVLLSAARPDFSPEMASRHSKTPSEVFFEQDLPFLESTKHNFALARITVSRNATVHNLTCLCRSPHANQESHTKFNML